MQDNKILDLFTCKNKLTRSNQVCLGYVLRLAIFGWPLILP